MSTDTNPDSAVEPTTAEPEQTPAEVADPVDDTVDEETPAGGQPAQPDPDPDGGFPGGALLASSGEAASIAGAGAWAALGWPAALIFGGAAAAGTAVAVAGRRRRQQRARQRREQSSNKTSTSRTNGAGGKGSPSGAGGSRNGRPGGATGSASGGVGRKPGSGTAGGSGKRGLFGRNSDSDGKGSGQSRRRKRDPGGSASSTAPGGIPDKASRKTRRGGDKTGSGSPDATGKKRKMGKSTGPTGTSAFVDPAGKGKSSKPLGDKLTGSQKPRGPGTGGKAGGQGKPYRPGAASATAPGGIPPRTGQPHMPRHDHQPARDVPAISAPPSTGRGGTGPTPPPPGGPTMGRGFTINTAAQQVHAAARAYEPTDMMEFGQHLRELPEAFGAIAEAMKVMTIKMHERWPLHPAVVAATAELYRVQKACEDSAAELPHLFSKVHATDIGRHTNPRRGETMWNPTGRRQR